MTQALCGEQDGNRLLTDAEVETYVKNANPLNDALFKYLFATKGNEENLLRLLNDTLGPERSIVALEYQDRENTSKRYDGRSSRLDVLARAEDGRLCHVEVQLGREACFFERSVYYAACTYSDQLDVSDGYDQLRPVIFVSILSFSLFAEHPDRWHSIHRLVDVEDHRSYCDSLEFHFLELPKLESLVKRNRAEDTGLYRLLCYLGKIGGVSEMERLVESDAGVERLQEGVRSFFRTRGNLAFYRMQERAETDYRNALKAAAAEAAALGEARGLQLGRTEGLQLGEARGLQLGRTEGIQLGEAKGRAEVARQLLAMHLPLAQVAQATGLPLSQLEELRAQPSPD